MDDLLKRQSEILKEIEKINTNFRKDGSSRKNSDYIKRRLNKLEELFAELENNDRELSKYPYTKTDYYVKGIFEQIRGYYTSTLSMITSYTPIPEDQEGSSEPPFDIPDQDFKTPTKQDRGENSKSDDLMKKQSSNFRAFTRTVANINLESITEKWEFEDLLKTLQARWAAIDSLHWEIDSELEGSNSVYEKAFTNHEVKYNDIKKAINSKLWSVAHIEKYTPQMKTPEFSGNYHHWQSFKDLFCATIHNNPTLSDGQKMQFLKTKVKGEAERLIQHLPVTADNYKTSWDILQHRYDNKKLIFNSHISIMLSIPAMQQPTVGHIKNIHDSTLESLNAIKNLGVEIETWDPLLVYLLTQKLDTQTHNDYLETLKQPRDLPTIQDFLNFLEAKFTSMEAARQKQEGPLSKSYTSNQISSSGTTRNPKQSFIKNKRNFPQCPLCNENHGIYYCEKFLQMSPIAKARTVAKLNLCTNCLFNHNGKPCIATKRCQECRGDHNTILHAAFHKTSNPTPKVSMAVTTTEHIKQLPPSVNTAQITTQNEPPQILLATALIKVQALNGTYYDLRALIDQGSQISLISETAAQRLSLPRQKNNSVVTGVGIKDNICKGQVIITAKSTDGNYTFITNALVMKNLLKSLPNRTFIKPSSHYLANINLADPDFNIQRPVDILLGAEVYSSILMEDIRRSDETSMIAQRTRLGWILSGKVPSTSQEFNVNTINIDKLEKFWEIEDISDKSILSTEDNQCIQYYRETTKRKEDGRYEVKLPLKSTFAEDLGKSRNKAIAQFLQIEKKISKQNEDSMEYKRFIDEYRQLQHMKPADKNSTVDCYLPHHGVKREESSTTSLRVVFNASSLTSSGNSLNDVMARGPNLQQDLQSLILKWRQYPIAFTADIEKVFRQIWVHPDDQALQKIIWRDSPDEPIQDYQLTTITYGTKAAPFLAMMTLKQLAKDERDNYQGSQAPKVVEESFYMDDLLHGSFTLHEATKLKQDLIKLLKSGGFNLRKWSSNHPSLNQHDKHLQTKQDGSFEFKQVESTKTLGLRWNSQQDTFTFKSKIDTAIEKKITKRMLLSDISKIFDPLGWLTPLSTKLKLLFQQVWQSNCKWDDHLPENILNEWIKIKTDINNINSIKVPRWLGIEQASDIELHGFSDSSMKAFAAVIYIKINKANQSKVILVAAKSRIVSQKKNTSLPRLELCAAELLARLMNKIEQCLPGHNIKKFGWTDSTAVLGWIQGEINRWKPFVANRVSQIKDVMGPECWRYVKSADNPADCASRGITATQLKNHPSWWSGPECIITTENFTVYSNKMSSSEMKIKPNIAEITIPQINHIMKLSVPVTNISDIIITTDATAQLLQDLGKKIEEIKNSEVLPSDEISYHDVHHYTAIYGIIFIATALGIYALYWRLSRRQKATAAAPASEQPPLELTAPPAFGSVGSSRDRGLHQFYEKSCSVITVCSLCP
ncbi:uncharacterized protein [Choristoneura fumiferana]|uniref:uncharacterized protein n=1 Tax=Choristoneura fumiferana TaxID=7141 RepID=UPI003D157080